MTTNNPIPSSDPTDLLFNAQKLDEVINSNSTSFVDRKGTSRKTLQGVFSEIDAVIADQFNLARAVSYKYKIGFTPETYVGQVLFTELDLDGGNVEVFFNGSHLFDGDDYSYTDTTLTLNSPCAANDVVIINNFRYPVTIIDGGLY